MNLLGFVFLAFVAATPRPLIPIPSELAEVKASVIIGDATTPASICGDLSGEDTFQSIAGRVWEYTANWDCARGDIPNPNREFGDGGVIRYPVPNWNGGSEAAVIELAACAQHCLDQSNCVAFNYFEPNGGHCWLKEGERQQSTELGLTCGVPRDTSRYYTLLTGDPPCLTDTPVDCIMGPAPEAGDCSPKCETLYQSIASGAEHGGTACVEGTYSCLPGDGMCPHTSVDCILGPAAEAGDCTSGCGTVTQSIASAAEHGGAACVQGTYSCLPGDGLCPPPCTSVTFTTRSDTRHARSNGPFTVDGYDGPLPSSCMDALGSSCTVSVCAPALKITAGTTDGWMFTVEDDDGTDHTLEGVNYTPSCNDCWDRFGFSTSRWGMMDTDQMDSQQEWEAFP